MKFPTFGDFQFTPLGDTRTETENLSSSTLPENAGKNGIYHPKQHQHDLEIEHIWADAPFETMQF
jgi:hypothetical protein